jgi:ElaB/YqjD/DUF883 family membrane-anchored ribosome-binding protein
MPEKDDTMNAARETVVAKDKLVADFKAVVADAEELLKATANQTGERAQVARARIEESLNEARDRLNDLQDDMIARGRAAARATNQMVHDNPWQAIGVGAAVGFLLGMLTGRR